MTQEEREPTLLEIWDFLVGLKETTEAGFVRVASETDRVRTELNVRIARAEVSLRADMSRIEARVTRIESWNLDRRFDAFDQRVSRLEPT